MEQAKGVLITGRRNFLVRALGFTAAGATLAVPVVAMETPEERIRHHMKGLEQAFADHYGRMPYNSFFRDDLGVAMVVAEMPGLPKGETTIGLYRQFQFPPKG